MFNLDAARKSAESEARRARVEEETAKRTSQFLVGLFRSADPTGWGGLGFRANDAEKVTNLTVRQILDRGKRQIREELKDQPLVRAALLDTIGSVYRGAGLCQRSRTAPQRRPAHSPAASSPRRPGHSRQPP